MQQRVGVPFHKEGHFPNFFSVSQESAMLTIDSDRDSPAHHCTNDVGKLNPASVDMFSSSGHCSVPNSCTAAVTDHDIVLIQVISEFHGVGIYG